MGFAPLDVWYRLLTCPAVTIPPRFWVRLALALALSLVWTILTLPERLVTALWLRLTRPRQPLPGPVIILGYYRSGTTLLQYLLGCDPHLYAPNWAQAFAPQGFCLSWFLLRWFVLPFVPRTRPQDNMAFGPVVPAEEDFALNNWALASTLPGRLVVPQAHAYFDRYHDLKDLTPAERARWDFCQLGFVRKLAALVGARRILLKTPAHTARIPALLEVYKHTTGPKFLYIARHPHAVFRSNVSMLKQLAEICGLQLPLDQEALEAYLLKEYVATEEEYQRTRTLIPPGDLFEMRLQDLQADPIGTMRQVYAQFGLPFTAEFEQAMLAYLHANVDYKPNKHHTWTPEQQDRFGATLQPLVTMGRHDQPAPPRVELPPADPSRRPRQIRTGVLVGVIVATVVTLPYLALSSWLGGNVVGFIWPCGVAIGVGVLRGAAAHGSRALGLVALLLTAASFLAVMSLAHALYPAALEAAPLALPLAAFWWALASTSAYRIGSQQF